MNNIENAVKKLEALDSSKLKDHRYGTAIAEDIKTALISLCKQSDEFSRAVCMGGELHDCINDISIKIKGETHISDIDLYRLAVKFYFSGAVVDFSLTIRMSDFEKPAAESTGTAADLSMLIDW